MTVKAHTEQHLNAMHANLAAAIGARTIGKEDSPTPIQSLSFFRKEQLSEPCACMVEPSIVFVVQGAKQLLIGEQSFAYDKSCFLLNSLDMPDSSQFITASEQSP